MKHILEKLEERRSRARAGGGQARVDAQHRRGKLQNKIEKRFHGIFKSRGC